MGSWLAWWDLCVAALGVDAAHLWTADPPAWETGKTASSTAHTGVRGRPDRPAASGPVSGRRRRLALRRRRHRRAGGRRRQRHRAGRRTVARRSAFLGRRPSPGWRRPGWQFRTPPSTTARSTRPRRTWRGCCWCSSARCTATTGSPCRSGCRSARWSGWTPSASPTRSAVCTS